MDHNKDLVKRWGIKKEKPAPQKPGKVLTFPETVARRLCLDCKHGSMEEVNFTGMEHIWKCQTCGSLLDTSKE
jgi:hypothetical protein